MECFVLLEDLTLLFGNGRFGLSFDVGTEQFVPPSESARIVPIEVSMVIIVMLYSSEGLVQKPLRNRRLMRFDYQTYLHLL